MTSSFSESFIVLEGSGWGRKKGGGGGGGGGVIRDTLCRPLVMFRKTMGGIILVD